MMPSAQAHYRQGRASMTHVSDRHHNMDGLLRQMNYVEQTRSARLKVILF
jgi:hypothetical protein